MTTEQEARVYPCKLCGWECEHPISLQKHLNRHNFIARLRWNIFTCWFCSTWMVDSGAAWPIQERINHMIKCYERGLAGGNPMAEALEKRREMAFA